MATITIGQWVQKTQRNIDQTVRGIKLAVFAGVIQDTRVDTGRLRGNWQTSTGAPVLYEIDRLDKTGNQAINQASSTITSNNVDYMSNNLPYAQVWEERDGMVKRNLARVTTIVRQEVAKAR
jgi:hypothetical protein